MRRVGVNFINILRTNVSYERRFGSFFYVQVTREKLPKQCLYEKFVRKMLMKLTIGWPSNYKLHTGKCLQASAQVNRVGYEVMLNISLQQMQKKNFYRFASIFPHIWLEITLEKTASVIFVGKGLKMFLHEKSKNPLIKK